MSWFKRRDRRKEKIQACMNTAAEQFVKLDLALDKAKALRDRDHEADLQKRKDSAEESIRLYSRLLLEHSVGLDTYGKLPGESSW